MNAGDLPLPRKHFPKALLYMRALRRALLSYWYATIEDSDAAAIEAATATFYVNILDESVFSNAFGAQYASRRANDRLGRVVMGLELIRNCETHAPTIVKDLLVERMRFGVPAAIGGQLARSVFAWTTYDALPSQYRELAASAGQTQRRARAEAQDGYRKAVQTRNVAETVFDAVAFFETLDCRLVGKEPPSLRWAYCEMPNTDPEIQSPDLYIVARPLGLDVYEPLLPDIACRYFERRSARWPAADGALKALVRQARKVPPQCPREVRHRLIERGNVVGYSGYSTPRDGSIAAWVERRRQVWRDVRSGHRYFVRRDTEEVDLECGAHEDVCGSAPFGDLLDELSEPESWALSLEHLYMVEEYDDLYLEMRSGSI